MNYSVNQFLTLLNKNIDLEIYQLVIEKYPEIEINKLVTFMDRAQVVMDESCKVFADLRAYFDCWTSHFQYNIRDEGYLIFCSLKFGDIIHVIPYHKFSVKALEIIIQFYYKHPEQEYDLIEFIE